MVDHSGTSRCYPPIATGPAPAISRRFLSEADRMTSADLHRSGHSQRSIASELRRSPSTISRELRRNLDVGSGQYRPHAAQKQAASRRARPKVSKLAKDPVLRNFVQTCLEKRWSPEQICASLPVQFPGQSDRHLVHESICQALYVPGRGALRRELVKFLRTGRTRRKPHHQANARRSGGFAESMVVISERPAEAQNRVVAGHWEGDLIAGAGNGSAIGTVVERTTRFLLLLHLPGEHTAVAVRDALVQEMLKLPPRLRRSLTWDQGKEMVRHLQFSTATDMPVFFCDPHSPWQRGSNENTNGLLQQYFPKGTDLTGHSAEHLIAVAAELNGRPRKTLGWDTPSYRLATLLASAN